MSEPAPADTTEEGTAVEASIPPQLAVLHNKKHPLEHAWCFWYDSRRQARPRDPRPQFASRFFLFFFFFFFLFSFLLRFTAHMAIDF